ncbi:hypothetical protein MB02_12290 [Croceicoccus estronivorus]|uniref:biotin/lipoyl-containing protein n=1 Tax=Croceicoccus estronivorus TaxID=1172626 RepID=UPI000832E10E|nr:biotin/lipoyl-containing protein [Croceicoccus estronivorus]OCC23390.1 hypothetical protein MB02_12290 [Croceicoccus estronivorus]
MQHIFTIDGERADAWLSPSGTSYALIHEGEVTPVKLTEQTGNRAVLTLDGQDTPITIVTINDQVWVHIDGAAHEVVLQSAIDFLGSADGGASSGTILAPMPGTVISVQVAVGDAVSIGETLMIIESMKLETAIKAPRDGVIETLGFAAGQTFDQNALLVTLEGED